MPSGDRLEEEHMEPKVKRTKLDDDPAAAPIRGSLLDPESRSALRAAFDASQPYTHAVLRDLVDPQLLREVREEIISNIQATYKETDLFKVFQTGDFGNLDSLDPEQAAKLPSVMRLKAALYSHTFRQFIRDITGCGELAENTDCSGNVYAQSCHLLCHDDVIGNRRVSWILYLTDPDEPWTSEDGGALELYPLATGQAHTPDVSPTTLLLPHWNSMALFTVQPGRSFHSVQEVLAPEKPRLSISGWFHAPCAPRGGDAASLQQLQLRAGQDALTQHAPFGSSCGEELSQEDLQLLARWLNPAYLGPAAWAKIRSTFEADGSVQLQRFLLPHIAAQVVAAAKAADAADRLGRGRLPAYDAGIGGGWAAVGPPHKQRYLRYHGPADDGVADGASHSGADTVAAHGGGADSAAAKSDGADGAGADGGGSAGRAAPEAGQGGAEGSRQPGGGEGGEGAGAAARCGRALAGICQGLFESAAFGRLLKALTTITLLGHAGEVRRMRPGLDYTVAHYGIVTKAPRLDCVLCFVDDDAPGDAAGWGVGEVGGFEAYVLADEEDGAAAGPAEVYRQGDDDAGVINVPAASNSLNLLLRDEGLMRFIKYVSAAAPGSRWDIAMEYLPEDDSSSDEEERGEKSGGAAEPAAGRDAQAKEAVVHADG